MIPEKLIDFYIDMTMETANGIIKEKMGEQTLRKRIEEYIRSQSRYINSYALDEEIDYQSLKDYLLKNLLDDVNKYISSLGEHERTVMRRKIEETAMSYASAENEEAKNRVRKIINDCINIIEGFYRDKTDPKDYVLANEVVNEIKDYIKKYEKEGPESNNSKLSSQGTEPSVLKQQLWNAAKRDYDYSHQKGSRFHGLNILTHLLPRGHLSDHYYEIRGETEEGENVSVIDYYHQSDSHFAIFGDGGIGKTTFLQYLLRELLYSPDGTALTCSDDCPVPFFIELNRCPDNMGNWFESAHRKTNFITRYLAQLLENHRSLEHVSPDILCLIEKELQRTPVNGKPEYLLLLDGYNEVRTEQNIRSHLSKEILVLRQYPNVRLITTSRETQSAYFTKSFINLRLIGLQQEDIKNYLTDCGMDETSLGEVLQHESLMNCLRIPLYLCMFSSQMQSQQVLPETAGEILYAFFHRETKSYNARRRIAEIDSSTLTEPQIALVLDFILPYIGWRYENNDTFYMNEEELSQTINDCLEIIGSIFCFCDYIPVESFHYQGKDFDNALDSLRNSSESVSSLIITCVYDYLGIVYHYQVNDGDFSYQIRYSFCHHHFRDYFSSIWDIRLLSFLPYVQIDDVKSGAEKDKRNSISYYLNQHFWAPEKVHFISEILMEHRNRPFLNPQNGNWYLPKETYVEQKVLSKALEFCRKEVKNGVNLQYFVKNILAAILFGRKEYSGLNLCGLDLRQCSFYNITCSRRGRSRTLAARFDDAILSQSCFSSQEHQNNVIAFVYHDNSCYTIDLDGRIKCWDIRSGNLKKEWQTEDPIGVSGFSDNGFLRISADGHWLATKVQKTCHDGVEIAVLLMDLTAKTSDFKTIRPPHRHNTLNYFNFTDDSAGIMILCDRTKIYGYEIQSNEFIYELIEYGCLKKSELYAKSLSSDILIFTTEYDVFESGVIWSDDENDEDDPYDDDNGYDDTDEGNGVFCELIRLNPERGKARLMFQYSGEPNTAPVIAYVAKLYSFLFYNYDEKQLERFDCKTEKCEIILEELWRDSDTPPMEIHPHPVHGHMCYLMYSDVCFTADISPNTGGSILMSYSISAVEKLLAHSDSSGELQFVVSSVPSHNRMIVNNDTNTYEWDISRDTLTRKYNFAYYECTSIYKSPDYKTAIVINRQNGVSCFSGEPIKQTSQLCFQEQDYLVDLSAYHEKTWNLALVFARPDHEKVILLDIQSGVEKIVFSSIFKGETVVNLDFNEAGSFLLITTQYRCLEYELDSGLTALVMQAGENERIAGGHYRAGQIEIAVTEHSILELPHFHPYCVYFDRFEALKDRTFTRRWYYLMPDLNREQSHDFIFQTGDLGELGAIDEEGIQSYWVTRGLFLKRTKLLANLFCPKAFEIKNGKEIILDFSINPLEELFVIHKHALRNPYGIGESGYSFMYFSKDTKEAIITKDQVYLLLVKHLSEQNYAQIKEQYETKVHMVHPDTYWNQVIPWAGGRLVGCFESYRLMLLSAYDNALLSTIEYIPGISIIGCRFKGINADTETKKLINISGGIL